MNKITIDDMRKCAKRELSYRKFVYPRQVLRERITQKQADFEIACMQAIVDYLYAQVGNGELNLK
jgi:hypothetical protein